MQSLKSEPAHLLFGKSTLSLILFNLLTIVVAVVQGWNLLEVMWVYWAQSVIIGIFNWRRILDLKSFSTKGLKINDRSVEPTPATQRSVAQFFLLHYGIFHLVYFFFLFSAKDSVTSMSWLALGICVLGFVVNHAFSYWHNREREVNRVPNIGTIMFFPYARILPMHFTLGIATTFKGASVWWGLVLFLGLKTLADVIMHMVEHALARQSAKKPAETK